VRAAAKYPAECRTLIALFDRSAVAFRIDRALGIRVRSYFGAVTPRLASLVHLRIAGVVSFAVARLTTE